MADGINRKYIRKELLSSRDFLEYAHWAGLPKKWNSEIVQAIRIIHSNPMLASSYLLAVNLFLDKQERYDAQAFRYWPDPEETMGDLAPFFYILLSLECVPLIRSFHESHKIPKHVTHDTCSSIGSKCHDYYFFHGRPGTMKWALWWFRYHIRGVIYRIGRLEFMLKQLYDGVSVFQKNGRTIVLCTDPESGKTITLNSNGRRTRQHSLNTWKPVLVQGDYVLDIHIPGGGRLSKGSIDASLSSALHFFDLLHADKEIKGFESVSWVFSPDLEYVFPQKSNLILFRNRLFPFPVRSRKVEGLEFIFGNFSTNPKGWPQKTSLQRRLTEHITSGGTFRMSGIVLPRICLTENND